MISRFALAGVAAFTIVGASAALAQNAATVEPFGGRTLVLIWKDHKAHQEANQLIDAGVGKTNPALIHRLLACAVPGGTKVIVTDGGFATQDIMVIEGPHSGCRGNIPTEELKR